MAYMFKNATAFNRPLENWQVGQVKSMYQMLDGTRLSTENYDKMFIAWERQALQNGVVLGATSLKYCRGYTFRNLIVSRYGWVILGDSYNCSNCTGCRQNEVDIAAKTDSLPAAEISKSNTELKLDFAYPNPATDRLYIKNVSGTLKEIFMTDATGRVMANQRQTGNQPIIGELPVNHFPAGAYTLKFIQKNGSFTTQKIIVTK